MNDQTSNAADANELQFNEAEYAAPTAGEPICAACRQTIPDNYFQLNGAILCERCSASAKAALTGGSSLRRFVKACLYGLGAAMAGFAIYFGVLKLTGWEIGLISILVGLMVGAAVRKGSEGRGGAVYQMMAVFFTYLAIALSYSALVIPQMFEKIKADGAAAAQPKDVAGGEVNKAADATKTDDDLAGQKTLTPFDFVIAIGALFAFMLALPILAGFEQPIGLMIIAFALWEAFKLNRKANVVVTGPHNVGHTPDPTPAHV